MTINDRLLRQLARDGVIQMGGVLALLMPARANVAFGVKGLDGRYRLANHEMRRLLSGDGGRLDGKSERDILPLHLQDEVVAADDPVIHRGVATCATVELPVNGRSHRYLWLKLPVLGPGRELQAIASILHDAGTASEAPPTANEIDHLRQRNRELQRAVIDLEEAAGTDLLTGVWNRRRLEECVRREIDRLNRYQQPLSLLLVDIDHFKAINDDYNHTIGDQVLRTVSELLQSQLRGSDVLARWGGEEFVVVCPNTGRATAAMLGERLRQLVAGGRFSDVGKVTVSIGVAECVPGETWETAFQRADAALYRAKSGGRNQVQVAPAAASPVTDDGVVADFVQLIWDPAYECGNDLVDHGHRQLFADANDLLSAILSKQSAEQVDAIVETLISDVLAHFSAEESAFQAAGYPDAALHISQHQVLIGEAQRLLGGYRCNQRGVGDVFEFLACEVITRHMLGADRLFFPYLAELSAAASVDRELA